MIRDSPQALQTSAATTHSTVIAEERNTPCIIEHQGWRIGHLRSIQLKTCVRLMLTYLFPEQGAVKCILEPHASSDRVVRGYEKAGFRRVRLLQRHILH